MKVKTKTVKLLSITGIVIGCVGLVGCGKVALPQPPVPDFFAETEIEKPSEMVVKHISLFKQGIAFDILDNNESRDATGVIIEKDSIKVMNDIITIEKKSKKETIESFLDNNNTSMENCYSIKKDSENNWYEIYKFNRESSCPYWGDWDYSQIVYIYNNDKPDMVIKITQPDKNNSPRADLEQSKIRYESLTFL